MSAAISRKEGVVKSISVVNKVTFSFLKCFANDQQNFQVFEMKENGAIPNDEVVSIQNKIKFNSTISESFSTYTCFNLFLRLLF